MSDGLKEVFMWFGIGVFGIVFALGVLFVFCIVCSAFDGGGGHLPAPPPKKIPGRPCEMQSGGGKQEENDKDE